MSTVGSQQEMKNFEHLHPRCMCLSLLHKQLMYILLWWGCYVGMTQPTYLDMGHCDCLLLGDGCYTLSISPPPSLSRIFFMQKRGAGSTIRNVRDYHARSHTTYNIIVRVRWCSHFLSLLLKGQTHEKDGPKKNNSGVDWAFKISYKF